MLRAAWTVALKDLRLFLRDRVALAMSFALPIVLATVFASAMAGMSGDDSAPRVELLVEDLDGSTASKALVAQLQASKSLDVEVSTDVRSRVSRGKAPAAVLVPSGFGADVEAGKKPRLVLYRDPAKEIEQQIVMGNLVGALFEVAGPAMGRAMMSRGMEAMGFPAGMREAAERMADAQASDGAGTQNPFDFADQGAESLGLEVEDVAGGKDSGRLSAGKSHAIAGIAVMMLLFGLTACGGTILEEEASGTLQRVRLSPNAGPSMLLGKMAFTMIVGICQLIILFTYGGLVFDVPVARAPLALFVLSVAVAAAAAGFGLCLAVLCRTTKQLEGFSTLLILTMSALGGSWFPLVIAPEWFRTAGHFTLNAWAMDGYQGVLWYGKDLAGIATEVLVLLGIAAATGFVAWRGWRRRFERLA